MKTVKIILKFKFLTLFSDKIIQCYTESTVYTIITLFLYGIGAIYKCFSRTSNSSLHYSYMELELDCSKPLFSRYICITLFLYGIGAILYICYTLNIQKLHYSYMELEQRQVIMHSLQQ